MLDIKFIKENAEEVKKVTEAKQLNPSLVDKVLELDAKRRTLIEEIDNLRSKRNQIAKEGKASDEGKKIKEDLKEKEPALAKLEGEYKEVLWQIPNLFSPDTPFGKDESENKVVRKWETPRKFDFEPKDHLDLGENLEVIDVKRAAEVTGPRFGYFKGGAAMLEFALIQYAISVLTDENILKTIADKVEAGYNPKPFIPVVPPVMIKPDVFDKMVRLNPKEERYYIQSDDIYLIGSAEHTLGPLHMNETLPENKLPIRYVGFSTSFRREAGSSGKDVRGVLRVHQFDKIEMETFTLPENSIKEQDFIIGIQEYLVQSLNIPYEVVAICTGDMGKPDYRQVDINMWLPGQDKYRETHTSDMMTDYQARRLNTKVKREDGRIEYAHMNDATAFAIGRTIIAILENYQEKDGSVVVPEILRKWVDKDRITTS